MPLNCHPQHPLLRRPPPYPSHTTSFGGSTIPWES